MYKLSIIVLVLYVMLFNAYVILFELSYVKKAFDIPVTVMKTGYYVGNGLTLLSVVINILNDFKSITHRHIVAITVFSMIINFFVFALHYAELIKDYYPLCFWFNIPVGLISIIVTLKAKKYGFLNFSYDKT